MLKPEESKNGISGLSQSKGQLDLNLGLPASKRTTKKQRIIELQANGLNDIAQIADVVQCPPSYVASVLQQAGRLQGYYDLYTQTSAPMNVYTKFLKGRLGFKNLKVAQQSLDLLEKTYALYQGRRDRAGQHHVLITALTLFDRARWSRKKGESEIFRNWLIKKLYENNH